MKKFLLNNWGKLLLALLLVVISVLSFKTGYSYISSDNYSPDLNPLLTIERSIISPAWRSYRVLGFASESEQADVFRSMFYYILDFVLPTWSLSQVFALLCFTVGSWFTALLSCNLFKDFGKKKYSELVFLLSGIIYITTLWTVWVYYLNMFPYISQFGFLPLLVWSIYRLIKDFNWKNALITFVCSIVFTSTCVIATLFVVDIVVISFLTLVFAIFNSRNIKEILKKTILTILLFICTQLFWILPFVHYTVNVSGDIMNSYVNRSITTSVIDLESQEQDAVNSAKLFTRTVLETQDDEYVFQYAEDYATYDFYDVVGLLPAILVVILLVGSILKKNWIFTILSITVIGIWFVMKNINPPLGNVFLWFQEYIPLFKQVFRWASSKTGNVYLFLLSICASLGFVFIIDFLSSFFKKGLKITFIILATLFFTIPTFFYAQYLFTGETFPQRSLVQVPQEYYDIKDYLEENDQISQRILYLPPANNNYFRTYDWGFWGSNFISYILPNPVMDLSSAIGSKFGEDAVLEITQAFRAKDVVKFEQLIDKYNIEYLLIDKSLDENGFTFSWGWNEVDSLWEDRELAYSTSNLYLYNTSKLVNSALTESNSGEVSTFEYMNSNAYSTKISLKPEVYQDWNIEDNRLVSDNIYQGEDITLINKISQSEILHYPTSITIVDNSIFLYPSVPFINQLPIDIYKQYSYNGEDIITVDGYVFRSDELINSVVSIDSEFGHSHTISLNKSANSVIDNLTINFSNSTPYECISGTREETTQVNIQGLASGFELSGEDGNPCIYSNLNIDRSEDNILGIRINWETTNDSLLGYCIYSQNEERCLNNERYFSSIENVGEIEEYLKNTISKSDYTSLILYAINPQGSPEVLVRNVSVNSSVVGKNSNIIRSNLEEFLDIQTVKNGSEYSVNIPVIISSNSYNLSNNNTVWQPNISDENSFKVTNNDSGIYQEVQSGFANVSINLFESNPFSRYLFYWKGQNTSNIPANLCIAYLGESECWIQDMLFDGVTSSNLQLFSSDARSDRLDLSLVSTSYSLLTRNILNDLVVMEYPKVWEDLQYLPEVSNIKYEIKAEIVGGDLSTMYGLDESIDNGILSIPQAFESGWLALSFKNSIPHILNDRVVINGWKQGWDISQVDYDSIYVIYYPNLLAYIGYVILATEFVVIVFNLVKRKNG
jgi:hypothetical protein